MSFQIFYFPRNFFGRKQKNNLNYLNLWWFFGEIKWNESKNVIFEKIATDDRSEFCGAGHEMPEIVNFNFIISKNDRQIHEFSTYSGPQPISEKNDCHQKEKCLQIRILWFISLRFAVWVLLYKMLSSHYNFL